MFAHRSEGYKVEEGSLEEFLSAIEHQKSKLGESRAKSGKKPLHFNYLEKKFDEAFGKL